MRPAALSRTLLIGLALVAASALTRGQLLEQSTRESDAIRGTVLNSLTHAPVSRALVYSPDDRFATLTDENGRFEFKLPQTKQPSPQSAETEAGEVMVQYGVRRPYALLARKPGFLEPANNFQQLSSDQENVTIYLTPEAMITGHVKLPSDTFERIQVELDRREIQNGTARWITAGSLVVRSDGGFRFPELPAGEYKVFTHELLDRDPLTFDPRGQLFGYPPVYYPAAPDFASAQAILLETGANFDATLTPTRREYYPVEIDIANAPLGQGFTVEVFPSGQPGPGYALSYNARQQRIQGSLPDGNYTLQLWTFGQPGESGDLNFSVSGGPARALSVAFSPNTSISVNLTEEFTSTEDLENGSVVTFAGPNGPGPRRDVQLFLEPVGEFDQRQQVWLRQPSGSEDASLVFENVRPGRYWLGINPARGYVASVKCGETDLLRHPLVVTAGGTPPIELTLRDDGAQIEGTVENLSGKESSRGVIRSAQQFGRVCLVPLPESSGQFREEWVSPGGEFAINQVPPGDYRVLAFDREPKDLDYRDDAALTKYEALGQEVSLVAGQKQRLSLSAISGSGR